MGTYMGIGIVNKIIIEKENLNRINTTIDKVQDDITKEFNIDFDIYSLQEDNRYVFSLKDNVIENQLVSFLKEVYRDLYDDSNDYQNVIETINGLKADEIIEFAKAKREYSFQYDNDGYEDYIRYDFGRELKISYEIIMISIEGKIIIESYKRHFNFFKNCIVKAYPQYKISHSMKVYITS